MKTLLASIILITVTMLNAQALAASDLHRLYPEQLKQAKNLYPLAYRYFKGPGSLAPGETLTPEMVKNPLRQQMYYKIWQLLGLAVDAEFDLSAMAEFGLLKEGDGYVIHYNSHPQWAKMSSLFSRLQTPKDLILATPHLKTKGFSQNDIDILHNYLTQNNPVEQTLLSEKQLIQSFASSLTEDASNAPLPLKSLLTLHESVKHNQIFSWNKWSTALLNSLSQQKQRILLSYLQDNLGVIAIAKLPLNIEALESFESRLKSGIELNSIEQQLSQLSQQTLKE